MNDKAGSRKKYAILAAVGVICAAGVWALATHWPPVPRKAVQGAIGQRDVYRQPQMADKDVGLAGKRQVTTDDLRAFMKSKEFAALAGNSAFQLLCTVQGASFLNSPGVTALLQNPAFTSIVFSQPFAALSGQSAFNALLNAPHFSAAVVQAGQNAASNQQVQGLVKQYLDVEPTQNLTQLMNSKDFAAVMAMPGAVAAMTNAAALPIMNNPAFQSLCANPAFTQLLQQPALPLFVSLSQVQSMAQHNQLENLPTNVQMQGIVVLATANAAGVIH